MSNIIYFSNDIIEILCTFSTDFCTFSIEYILKFGNSPLFKHEKCPRKLQACLLHLRLTNSLHPLISLRFIYLTNIFFHFVMK